MPPDLTLQLVDFRDEFVPQRDGRQDHYKLVRFYLGTFGPFVERFDAATYTDDDFHARVRRLRATIDGMHR